MTDPLRAARERIVENELTGLPSWRIGLTNRLTAAARAALTADAARPGLDVAYRERNAVVAALIRTNGWPHCVAMADDAPGWVIVYAKTPQGQVSWHVGPDDFDLIADFPSSCVSGWDGHTTEEKYQRLARLTEDRP